MRRWTSIRRADDGVSLVEFAMVAPMFAMLLVGAVEFGRYAAFNVTVANAARAGAAYGSQPNYSGDATGIQTAACNDAQITDCPDSNTGKLNALNVTGPFGTSSNPQFYFCTYAADASSTPDPNAAPQSSCPSQTSPIVQRNLWVQVTVSGTFTPLFSYPGLPSTLPVSSTATVLVPEP